MDSGEKDTNTDMFLCIYIKKRVNLNSSKEGARVILEGGKGRRKIT